MVSHKKNILFIGGSDMPYHQLDEYKDIITPILKRHSQELTVTEDLDSFLPEHIKDFSVILSVISEKEITAEQESGLLEGISGLNPHKTGKPKTFIGIHAAATAFSKSAAYHHMLGGRFLSHPQMGEPFKVIISKRNHPICKTLKDFTIIDEQYLLETYGNFTTLFHTPYNGFVSPLGWIKQYGMGKVFYSALGHGKDQMLNKNLQTMIENAVSWA